MFSSVVNAVGVIIGSLIGLFIKKGIPERFVTSITFGMALCVVYIGISGIIEVSSMTVAVFSMVIGTVIGEWIDIDKRINNVGNKLESKFSQDRNNTFSKGFVTATLIYCVGGMAIVGSLESGLSGKYDIILTKTLLDSIMSVILASTYGIGVMFSAIPILIYQGAITIFASILSPVLSQNMITDMSFMGSLLIIGLALNMLKITKLKIMNYTPAIFMPIFIHIIISMF